MPQTSKKSFSFVFGIFITLILFYGLTTFFAPSFLEAQTAATSTEETGLLAEVECRESGNCGICDIVHIFITIGRWLIIGAGALALVIIVNASISMVTSAGNPDKISGAKKQVVGAILGMGITLLAFQLTSLVVVLISVPSSTQTFGQSIGDDGKGSEEFGTRAGLSDFLGIPWWNICDKGELTTTNEGDAPVYSTAYCKYWGQGTPCKTSTGGSGACCRHSCQVGGCANQESQSANFILNNSLPGDVSAGNVGQFVINENEIRSQYLEAGLRSNKAPCPPGVRYQDYTSIDDFGNSIPGCTTLYGLPDSALTVLSELKSECNCDILITGGTELGHNTHCVGQPIVDLRKDFNNQDELSQNIVRLKIENTEATIPNLPVNYIVLTSGARAPYYHAHGSTFLDEGDHWHVVLGQTVNNFNSQCN